MLSIVTFTRACQQKLHQCVFVSLASNSCHFCRRAGPVLLAAATVSFQMRQHLLNQVCSLSQSVSESVSDIFLKLQITSESISENEIVLCQYHYHQCQCCQYLQYQRQYHHASIISTSYSALEIKILTSSVGQFKSQMSEVR